MKKNHWLRIATLLLALLALMGGAQGGAFAQGTGFTYQGQLNDNGAPANGVFDFQFILFNAVAGGAQQGPILTRDDVTVASGVFTVTLDFGAAFTGTDRFLEIGVRPGASSGAFTLLSPRQPLTATPYAIRSTNAATADALSAACANCVGGAQLANGSVGTAQLADGSVTTPKLADGSVTTPKLADGSVTNAKIVTVAGNKIVSAIPVASVPAGSGSYIQNQNAAVQASSNFNISGDGTAGGTLSGNTVNAATQFNLGGSRVLIQSGTLNNENLFVGLNAGTSNTTGGANIFVGPVAGFDNATGSRNTFVGNRAGRNNVVGNDNTFFGTTAGTNTTIGDSNTFVGSHAGFENTIGNSNTALGYNANFNSNNLSHATAIGAGTTVFTSNTITLGRQSGEDTVRIPGILEIVKLGAVGSSQQLCRNAAKEVVDCSISSLRFKKDIAPLRAGLAEVNRLRPVNFTWKATEEADFGLIAEEVAEAAPLLALREADGTIRGVNYSHLSVVLVNAVKEQQQIIERQQRQLEQLKALVCANNPKAAACQEEKQ